MGNQRPRRLGARLQHRPWIVIAGFARCRGSVRVADGSSGPTAPRVLPAGKRSFSAACEAGDGIPPMEFLRWAAERASGVQGDWSQRAKLTPWPPSGQQAARGLAFFRSNGVLGLGFAIAFPGLALPSGGLRPSPMSDTKSPAPVAPQERRRSRAGRRATWGRRIAQLLCALFALIGLLPVVAGILLLGLVAWRDRARETEAAVAFWHMVDLVWVLLYPVIYLVAST